MSKVIDKELSSIKKILHILGEFTHAEQGRILHYIVGRYEWVGLSKVGSIETEKDDSQMDLLTKEVIETA